MVFVQYSVQTGEFEYNFNIERVSLTIASTSTTATISGANESITSDLSIENKSSFDIALGAIIEAFYDVNQNGIYDSSETIITSKALTTGITDGNKISESLSFSIPASQVCGVVIGLRTSENHCFCDDVFTSMVTPVYLINVAG